MRAPLPYAPRINFADHIQQVSISETSDLLEKIGLESDITVSEPTVGIH
jgi:hypothetical protein